MRLRALCESLSSKIFGIRDKMEIPEMLIQFNDGTSQTFNKIRSHEFRANDLLYVFMFGTGVFFIYERRNIRSINFN